MWWWSSSLLSLVSCLSLAQAAPEKQARVILAVFAHQDDETAIGPILARYAREGDGCTWPS